ncbi:hypothetical protein BCR41DRAFT_243553 [Lobosporangium transversale]|uniref:C2H2-type domain-containing protein n=1 Tax=Lobosporangium transversale TaxID=64571 RepID=A0A1Y2GTX2_9FUNG|nr:hypothetical protein BCR41DRAFT_243553 [Lobosporangium transversale]ORZ23671.1 hypothetical protein BCR41DRAFT_243553 [Lobosporangium transversale]|eukprot:XP_021883485.1 hypothetical protein BCR41DRAFT_243553 [Lobosporangium transversale]
MLVHKVHNNTSQEYIHSAGLPSAQQLTQRNDQRKLSCSDISDGDHDQQTYRSHKQQAEHSQTNHLDNYQKPYEEPILSKASFCPSPHSRNMSMSPKRESDDLIPHQKHSQKHSDGYLEFHRRRSLPLSQKCTLGNADEATMMDVDGHPDLTTEELPSDSLMDQCEPQYEQSSTSPRQTNSPSPVIPCIQRQFLPFPPSKRHDSSSSSIPPPLIQQDMPSTQQEFLSDERLVLGKRRTWPYEQGQYSSPNQFDSNNIGSRYHTLDFKDYRDERLRQIKRSSIGSSHSHVSFDRRRSPSPFTRVASSSCTTESSLGKEDKISISASGKDGDEFSISNRAQTPPFSQSSPSPQQQYRHERLRYDVFLPRRQEKAHDWDIGRDKGDDKNNERSNVLPNPNNFEFMSEAQRVLYERHPPSPKYERQPSFRSSSPPLRPTQSEASSMPLSPVQPIQHVSFEHRSQHHASRRSPSRINTDQDLSQNSRPSQTQEHHHQQQSRRQSGSHLPNIWELVMSKRHHQQEQEPYHENEHLPESSTKPSTTFAASVQSNLTGRSTSDLNLPGTEGMTVTKTEDGAIMVYNPITENMTFRCELCPSESFGRIHDLKRHQASKHQEMTWPCDFCHRPFVRRDALLRHYTVKAARDDGLHPASHEVERLMAARARAKLLY